LLRKKFPRQQRINSKSCTQAVSVSRLKLGIRSSSRGREDPDIARLRAAKQFVDQVGDIQRAIGILQQLADLQMNESCLRFYREVPDVLCHRTPGLFPVRHLQNQCGLRSDRLRILHPGLRLQQRLGWSGWLPRLRLMTVWRVVMISQPWNLANPGNLDIQHKRMSNIIQQPPPAAKTHASRSG
jgi:hypothetical protein